MSFLPGDRIRISEPDDIASPYKSRRLGMWIVVEDDTGKTITHDPEPAYCVTPAFGDGAGLFKRYVYSSAMLPA